MAWYDGCPATPGGRVDDMMASPAVPDDRVDDLMASPPAVLDGRIDNMMASPVAPDGRVGDMMMLTSPLWADEMTLTSPPLDGQADRMVATADPPVDGQADRMMATADPPDYEAAMLDAMTRATVAGELNDREEARGGMVVPSPDYVKTGSKQG